MKKYFLYLLALALFFSFSACEEELLEDPAKEENQEEVSDDSNTDENEEEENNEDDNSSGEDEDDEQPSDDDQDLVLSVEEHKAAMEATGLQMLSEMEAMAKGKAAKASASFVYFADQGDLWLEETSVDPATYKALAVMYDVHSYREGALNTKEFFANLRSIQETDEPESIQEAYNLLAGEYTYNSSTSSWDYAEASSIILNFPADIDDPANVNATYVIENYSGFQLSSPIQFDEYSEPYAGDLPSTLNAYLEIDGSKVMEYNFEASYQTDGIPTSIMSSLSMGDYTMSSTFNNTNLQTFSAKNQLKKGSQILLAEEVELNGDFSETATNELLDKIDQGTIVPSDVANVFTSFSYSYQVMNIKVTGLLDAANLAAAMDSVPIEELEGMTMEEGEEWISYMINMVNQYFAFKVVYADTNSEIARLEFYTYRDDFDQPNVNARFVFADETKVDVDVYFEDGFDDFVTEAEEMVERLDTEYSDYYY